MSGQAQREHWSSQLGFILVAVGSAVGLGTLWKFPYTAGMNGGGAFFLFYLFCVLFLGLPVFIAELLLGRRSQRAAVGTFDALIHRPSFWRMAGWFGVASSFLIMSYYSVLSGWGVAYFLMSLNQSYSGRTPTEIADLFSLLSSSGDITIFLHGLFTLVAIAVVWPGVRQGIERWSRFMTSALLLLLIALFGYATTLDGFPAAVLFLFSPNWEQLHFSSALEAVGLSFFTLSLGQGIMITYGSYMRRKEDIPKAGLVTAGSILFVSLLVGLVIFPVTFSFGLSPQAGPSLVFKTLPLLFSQLPGAMLISSFFFAVFLFAALTSAIALVEVCAANCIDLFGWSRSKAIFLTGVSCFLFGIPSALSSGNPPALFSHWETIFGTNFLQTVDSLVSVWLLPLCGLMTALFTGWVVDPRAIAEEFSSGSRFTAFFRLWWFLLRWVVPCAIILVIVGKSGLFYVVK